LSALTKLFVVLAVVLSLLLVSGLVVFVNRIEDFKKSEAVAKSQAKFAEAQRQDALDLLQAKTGEMARMVDVATARASASEQQLNTQLAAVAQLRGDLQGAKAEAAKAGIDASNAMLALKSSEESYKAADGNITALRKENDDLRIKYGEATVATTDLANKKDILEGKNRKLLEDVTDLQRQNDDLRTSGRTVAFPGTSGTSRPAASAEGMNLKGVIREKKNIQGVEYAVISLGSADQVAKGMQFKVIDRGANQFLGYLTIDSVDYNDATGHLSGPNVPAVRPGVEVVSNLQ
jgi:hypothetical protein